MRYILMLVTLTLGFQYSFSQGERKKLDGPEVQLVSSDNKVIETYTFIGETEKNNSTIYVVENAAGEKFKFQTNVVKDKGTMYKVSPLKAAKDKGFEYLVGNDGKSMLRENKEVIVKGDETLPSEYIQNPLVHFVINGPQTVQGVTMNFGKIKIVSSGKLTGNAVGTETEEQVNGNARRRSNDLEVNPARPEVGELVNGTEIRLGVLDNETAQIFKVVGETNKGGTTAYRMKGVGDEMLEFQATETDKGVRYRVKSKNGGTYDYLVGKNGKVMVKHNNKIIKPADNALPERYRNDAFLHLAMNGPEVFNSIKQNKGAFIELEDIPNENFNPAGTETGEPLVRQAEGYTDAGRVTQGIGTEAGEPVSGDSSVGSNERSNRDMSGVISTETPTGINPNQQSQEEAIANSGILIAGGTGSTSNGTATLNTRWDNVMLGDSEFTSKRELVSDKKISLPDPNSIAAYTVGNGNNAIEFTLTKGNTGTKVYETKLLQNQSEENGDQCIKDYFRTTGEKDAWKVFSENGYTNATLIMPGAIFDLHDFNGAFFTVVEGEDRKNLRIDLVDPIQGNVLTQVVNNPRTMTKIRNLGLNPILTGIKAHNYAAKISLDAKYERMYNADELDISLGGSVPYAGNKFSFDSSFSSNSERETYNYSVEYMEPYYTLVAAGPGVVSGEFFEDESLNSNDKYGYISSVTYGRRISVAFTSDYSESEMNTAAEAELKTVFAGDYDSSFSSGSVEEMENIEYTIEIEGGSPDIDLTFSEKEGTLATLMQDLTMIQNTGNNDARDAVPIYFSLYTLDGEVVQSDYSPIKTMVETCNPTYNLSLMQIKGREINEGNIADKEIELTGSWTVKQYDSNGNQVSSANYSFANDNNPIVFSENDGPRKNYQDYESNSEEAGNHLIPITHDDLQGYITIKINAEDYDATSADDPIVSSIHTYDVDEFDQKPLIIINARGDENDIEFHFQLIQD